IERVFGLAGLSLLVFVGVMWRTGPDWSAAAHSLVPNLPHLQGKYELALYGYFAVGIMSSLMMPYEVYFYSSGGVEEDWTPKDLLENKIITTVGFTLGMILSLALLILGAAYFL